MDLKRHTITVAELLARSDARQVLQRRFPGLLTPGLTRAAGSMTLKQVLELAQLYVPQKAIREALEELERL